MKKYILIFFTIFILPGFVKTKGEMAIMSQFTGDFQNCYSKLFENVEELNKFSKSNEIELKNVSVKDFDLNGATFYKAKFSNVKWEYINLEDSLFVDVIFENCHFDNVSFNGSKFLNVSFINSEISSSKLNRCYWKNGQFIKSNIKNSGMVKWQGDAVDFDGGTIIDSPLAQGNLRFSFKGVHMDGVRLTMTEGLFPLILEDSFLSKVDFGKSQFTEVVLRNVKQGSRGVRFNDVVAKTFSLEGVDMPEGLGFAFAKADSLRINESKIGNIGFGGSMIAKVYIRNSEIDYLSVNDASMPHLDISNCQLNDLGLWEGSIDEFIVHNSSIVNIVGEAFKGNIAVWHNVTLDGKVDLRNAQVRDFRPTFLKHGPNLELITTGSNLRF